MVDEEGEIAWDKRRKAWQVVTRDGRELTVPASAAVVIWSVGARRTAAPARIPEVPSLAALFPSKGAPMAQDKGHLCAGCGQWYLRGLDAYLCARRDDVRSEPFKAKDCRSCGYPLDLHEGVEIRQEGTETRYEEIRDALGKMKERIPHQVPGYRAKLSGDAPPDRCVILYDLLGIPRSEVIMHSEYYRKIDL